MERYIISEDYYCMSYERKFGSLFTTSNGYMGIRGSFEENATIGVQGAFVRGLIDEIPFRQDLSIDSDYMRKFYVNEDAAKEAEVQEGIINFADVLYFKITIAEETFYPWEGKIHSWKRFLDIKNNVLTRSVVWENTKGDITELKFERFASFANDHFYIMRVSVKPVNHSKNITVESGIDFRTKSGGFKMTDINNRKIESDCLYCDVTTKGIYKHKFEIMIYNSIKTDDYINSNKFIAHRYTYNSEADITEVFEKKICITTSRDIDEYDSKQALQEFRNKNYDVLFQEHTKNWSEFFGKFDIKIDGDDDFDKALRFCNYHTAVSIPRNDCVHSLSAKNLTGEGYNDYVWWDCEVFQCPVFIYAGAEIVKNMFMYRYNRLDAARKYAEKEGYSGARFPFISSVTGEEKVWKHVRHPYMQIHVVADVAWGIINYYNATADDEFIKNYGIEILKETAEYWVSRVEFVNNRYEILRVTGCDEHHPYVDNDAYTNYLVHYCLLKTAELCDKFGVEYNRKIKDVCDKLYLPKDKSGLIPQFDGYFELSRTLESVGGGGDGFQMKNAGGQYHLSQIIKQPDVMMLFSYIPNSFSQKMYQVNWDYYENMCEASSSLTYPVHAICAFDNNQLYRGYKYLSDAAYMDINDIHSCCVDGVHAGCSAGAWYGIVRGILGVEMTSDYIKINPKMLPWWNKLEVNLEWHKSPFKIVMDNDRLKIEAFGDIKIMHNGDLIGIKSGSSREVYFEEI